MSAKKTAKELALIGDVDDWEEDLVKELLELRPGAECTFYIDSGGGSITGALAITTLVRHRRIQSTGIVIGECSSATLLVYAACKRRIVTPHSTFLFHPIRWRSDKSVTAKDAREWARHFDALEKDMDELLYRLFGTADEQLSAWTVAGIYVTGKQMVAAGLAEMFEL